MAEENGAVDLGTMVEKIIGNPEFQGMVKGLRGEGGDAGDLMSRLPELMARLGPLMGGAGGEADPGSGPDRSAPGPSEPSPGAPASDPGEGPQSESAPPLVRGGRFNRRNAERLLAALRPYLGERRQGIVDKCMSVVQITELIGAAGMTDGSGRR